MRRWALFDLAIRPLFILLAAVFVPASVVVLANVGARRPASVIGVSSIICAVLGFSIAEAITEVSSCSFAWTLPRFRRALLGEFIICGVAVSALAALLGAVVATTPHPTFVVVAAGFAAFSLGGAVSMVPERSLLIPIAFVALFASRPSAPAALLDAPLATVTVALAVSALALWSAFGARTFRWSALTGPRRDGRFIWHEWPTMPWWPKRRRRPARPEPRSSSRARYVGTSILRGVVCSYRATEPSAWLAGLALCALCFVSVGPHALNSVRRAPLPSLWAILTLVAWMCASWSRRSAWRATLPWSRRHHLAVTCVRDLGDMLAFLLVIGPAIAVAGAVGDAEALGAVGRGIAVMLVFFPAIQWLTGPPTGGPWSNRGETAVLGLVIFVVFVVVLNLVVNGLPKLVSSGVAQAVVLGLLLVGSQMLNWRRLKRYFAGRDLVGEAR